jgi:hypothetical protein
MLGTIFNGGWRGAGRAVAALAFAGILAFAIWHDVSDGGVNAVQSIEARKFLKKYDNAVLTAQGAVRKAHTDSLASCSEVTDTCRASAHDAARKAALAALMSGGCLEWEMSEWSPTRETNDAARPKSRTEAETACAFEADELAQRMSSWSLKQN